MIELSKVLESQARRKKVEYSKEEYSSSNVRNKINCYSYALDNLYYSLEGNFYVGCLAGLNLMKKQDDAELLEALYKDFKALNKSIYMVSQEEAVLEGYYKIILLSNYRKDLAVSDFHFIREDSDGCWSQKFKGEYPERVEKGIVLSEQVSVKGLPYYKIGTFIVEK